MSERRPIRTVAVVSVVVGVVLVGLIALLASRGPAQATAIDSPLIGHAMPATSSTTLRGVPLDLSKERGRVLVLNFYASWCQPCQQEAPQLAAFQYDQSQRPDGARIVGVVFNDSDAAARRFARTEGLTYPSLVDPQGSIANAWGVESPPTTFLVDPDGIVARALVGPLTATQLDRDVAAVARRAGGAQ